MKNSRNIKRGDIFYADLSPVVGSEQGGIRPVLIVQNDIGNKYSPTTIIVTLTSKQKADLPTHVNIKAQMTNGLKCNSIALCEQFRTIDKSRLKDRTGKVEDEDMETVLKAMKVSLGM